MASQLIYNFWFVRQLQTFPRKSFYYYILLYGANVERYEFMVIDFIFSLYKQMHEQGKNLSIYLSRILSFSKEFRILLEISRINPLPYEIKRKHDTEKLLI